MQQFQKRAAYFEMEHVLNNNTSFEGIIKSVRELSDWASHEMGYDMHEAEAYARANIANIVRENQVDKMINRIKKDLLNSCENSDDASENISHACSILSELSNKLQQDRY